MKPQDKIYNVYDELYNLIEKNVSLKRARKTAKLNPGSKLEEVKNANRKG